jgi:hypothetical protein
MASPEREGISRRKLILSGGAAVGALALPQSAGAHTGPNAHSEPYDASAVPDESGWITGVVDRAEGSGVLHVHTTDDASGRVGHTRIELAPGATVSRDGDATLADFLQGEEVCAAGTPVAGVGFKATLVEAIYRISEASVVSGNGPHITTADGGVIGITAATEAKGGGALGHELAAVPPADLDGGDHVVVLGRKVPNTNRINANFIGLVVE